MGSIVGSIKNGALYAAVAFKGCSQSKGPFRQAFLDRPSEYVNSQVADKC